MQFFRLQSLRATQKAHLPDNLTTLPQHLQKLGYSTHMAGKWHLGFCNWRYTPTYRGFDSFVGFYNAIQDYYTHIGHRQGYDFRHNKDVRCRLCQLFFLTLLALRRGCSVMA